MPATRTYMEDEDEPDLVFKWTCGQIRARLRKYIEGGGMKTTELQRALGVNSNSWGRFMRYTGSMQGAENGVYPAATRFFQEMEERGEKMPKKKVTGADGPATGKKKGKEAAEEVDISGVKLEGQEADEVRVFESCDAVRRKIEAHLKRTGMTRAALLKLLAAQFETQPVAFQSKQLNDFLGKRGALDGNTSRVYYAGYVLFEKMRVAQGKEKSAHRERMEVEWPEGVDRSRRHDRVICLRGSVPVFDEYGKVHFQ